MQKLKFNKRRWVFWKIYLGSDRKERLKNPGEILRKGDVPGIELLTDFLWCDNKYRDGKVYDPESGNTEGKGNEKKYSSGTCIGTETNIVHGRPDEDHISTSYVERQNLTMRMSMRRFTRLTNAFSKKVENHCCAIALHFVYYNFVKQHKTLRITPAMAAGLTKRFMSLEDIVNLVQVEAPKKRGSYKKR